MKYPMIDKNTLWPVGLFPDVKPTGTEKGKTFTRKSKGQVARDSRRYRQHLVTKSVHKV